MNLLVLFREYKKVKFIVVQDVVSTTQKSAGWCKLYEHGSICEFIITSTFFFKGHQYFLPCRPAIKGPASGNKTLHAQQGFILVTRNRSSCILSLPVPILQRACARDTTRGCGCGCLLAAPSAGVYGRCRWSTGAWAAVTGTRSNTGPGCFLWHL